MARPTASRSVVSVKPAAIQQIAVKLGAGSGGTGTGSLFVTTTGAGSWVAPKPLIVTLYAWGTGDGGATSSIGGGGGACGRKRLLVKTGDTISWVIPTRPATNGVGEATVVTLPDGTVLTAGGGGRPAGGVCSGPWDAMRVGGAGGVGSQSGFTGEDGAAGGAGGSGHGGGGGSAGFFSDGGFVTMRGGIGLSANRGIGNPGFNDQGAGLGAACSVQPTNIPGPGAVMITAVNL